MKKAMLLISLAVVLGGCQIQQNIESANSDEQVIEDSSRQGDSTVTGTVTRAGGKFYLSMPDGSSQELDTYSHDLVEYVGQKVEVTGQYSGDTLFAGQIEVVVEE